MRKPPRTPLDALPGRHQPDGNTVAALADSHPIDVTLISNDWIWEQDAALRFTWFSANADAAGAETTPALGKTRPEMAGATAADLASPEWQAHLACLADHQPFRDFTFKTRRADGTTAWYRTSGAPLFDANGQFAGYRGLAANVTTFREREIATAETTRRLETILGALPDLLFEVDAEGRYTGFMTGPREAMVLPPTALPGKRIDEVLPPEVAALTMNAVARVMTGEMVRGLRYPLAVPDGTHWFELAARRKPAADAGGPATAILLVRDVSEDVSRRQTLGRLAKIVENMTNLVMIIDRKQRVVWVNDAFTAQTGWRLDEIRGRDLGNLVRCPETDPAMVASLSGTLAEGKPFHGEAVNQDRHGKRYWVDFNVLPLFDERGALDGFVSVETLITERKESGARIAALAAESQRMRTRLVNALEALSEGVVIFDDDDRLVVANSAFRLFHPEIADDLREGISQAELLRLGLARGAFPAAIGREAEWRTEQLARYSAARHTDEVETVDGRWLHRLDIRTSDGGRVGLHTDITERRAQLASLSESRRRMAQLIEAANVATFEWFFGTGEIALGGNFAKFVGYPDATPVHLTFDEILTHCHPDDSDVLRNVTRQLQSEADPLIEIEFRMRHQQGHWIWLQARGRVLERAADGWPRVFAGVFLDMTERKTLALDLEAGRKFLAEVMDSSIAAINVVNAQGQITYANAEAERIQGLSAAAILGRRFDDPVWQITAPDGGAITRQEMPVCRAILGAVAVRDVQISIAWPDGSRHLLSVNAVPVTASDGARSVVTSFRDITEEQANTRRLEQARAAAEAASLSKSSFLANMSHEIRTPLNGVLGMAELLDGIITEPRQKQMIGTIRRSGDLLLSILNSILDMSKIEAGKMELEQVPFDPVEISRQIEALNAVKAAEKGLDFEVMTNFEPGMNRIGDPHRLQQIINNLIGNAIKFTETGAVDVKVSGRAGKPLVIEVKDSGVGMTHAQVARVFDSFVQADGTISRRFGSTGLGMTIVKELVTLMGGEISLESTPGIGTRVRVTLPLREVAAAAPAPASAAGGRIAVSQSLAGLRLLAADDSATNRLVLREMLAGSGAELTLVENGLQAIDAWNAAHAAGARFDLALLDISMPVLDGIRALGQMRDLEASAGLPATPAIAMTANAMAHQVTEYIMAGFDSHLAKPFHQQELLHAIVNLARRR